MLNPKVIKKIYSTEEQIIGKNYDGKTMYSKTIIYTGNVNDGMDIEHGINNADEVDIVSALYRTTKSQIEMQFKPYYISTTDYFSAYPRTSKNIRIRRKSPDSETLKYIKLNLEYTKTTD